MRTASGNCSLYHNRGSVRCLPAVMITAVAVASSAQIRTEPVSFTKKCAEIGSITLLPVKFDCFYLTAGGIREYNDQWSGIARRQITRRLREMLTKKGYAVTVAPDEQSFNTRWAAMRHFYSVVNRQIQRNVFGTSAFPFATRTFTYSLPPLPDSLVYGNSDAYLFIDGFDDRATRRREQRANVAAVGSAIGVASMLLTGYGWISTVPEDRTLASCALVNKSGEVIWYFLHTETGSLDMTNEYDVEKFFNQVLGKFMKREVLP